MGHRDDFYRVDHIIGYTGKIGKLPTVYFRREIDMGIEFGRITQTYPRKSNIGRGRVHVERDYKVYNVQVKESVLFLFTKIRTQAFEYYDGDVQHISRNAFVKKEDFEENDLNVLAQSIIKFTEKKTRYKDKNAG